MPANRQDHDALNRPRRFWKDVSVAEEGLSWAILLDGRPAKTPVGARLVLPTRALAELVAQEWSAVGEHVNFGLMPATRLAFTAIDRIGAVRDAVAQETAAYAASDLICYFAEGPQALVAAEEAGWGPMLDWAHEALGLELVRTAGIAHRPQPPETVAQVAALALELDDFGLAGLSWASALFGSAVLALAVQRARLGGREAYALSRLDEAFQEERWGVDDEAAARTATLASEAELLERWFVALR
ncbi:MAG: ATPase [Proteobacteria bacterium]|nr:ATPase [Pseudomonadota bacterium]